MRRLLQVFVLLVLILASSLAQAEYCDAPDNGNGTADLPPQCPSGYEGSLTIIDGLPAGTMIIGPAALMDFDVMMSEPGGIHGGEIHRFQAMIKWEAEGTGQLSGFYRTLMIPVEGEMHSGPRNPDDQVQEFPVDLFSLAGQLFGDPDFCSTRIVAGGGFGLPSPGSTILTRLPNGNFNVDSFFDITYQIEFEGCPGSILEGLAGVTTLTERYQAGEPYTPPVIHSCLLPNNGQGTVDLPPECPDGYIGALTIVNGLPAGTTLTGEAALVNYFNIDRIPGSPLGGPRIIFEAEMTWNMVGTGALQGFARNISMPVVVQLDTGPVDLSEPIQVIAQEVALIQGQLFGDPDFQNLVLAAGYEMGLPSPGQTTLTELRGGGFAVDSFFDISYQINFQGAPGSILDGLSGGTMDVERFQAGEEWNTSAVGPQSQALSVLYANVPNPFNPSTVISYELPASGARVLLDVFDVRGRHVANLVNEDQAGGLNSVTWRGQDSTGRRVASGVYYYRLKAGQDELVRKMAILK